MQFAELYDKAFSWDPSAELSSMELIWERVLGRKPRNLCDIGAGTGRFAIPLLQRGAVCLAVEPDAGMAKVLRAKVNQLDAGTRSRFNLVGTSFEQFSTEKPFESVIALTDTLSYVWPKNRLHRFLQTSRSCLEIGGLAVIDVALWAGYPGERRCEHWSSRDEAGIVKATCEATVFSAEGDEGSGRAARMERLTFDWKAQDVQICLSQEKLLHALTFDQLAAAWEQYGFEVAICVVPGTRFVVTEPRQPHKRLMIGFQRTR